MTNYFLMRLHYNIAKMWDKLLEVSFNVKYRVDNRGLFSLSEEQLEEYYLQYHLLTLEDQVKWDSFIEMRNKRFIKANTKLDRYKFNPEHADPRPERINQIMSDLGKNSPITIPKLLGYQFECKYKKSFCNSVAELHPSVQLNFTAELVSAVKSELTANQDHVILSNDVNWEAADSILLPESKKITMSKAKYIEPYNGGDANVFATHSDGSISKYSENENLQSRSSSNFNQKESKLNADNSINKCSKLLEISNGIVIDKEKCPNSITYAEITDSDYPLDKSIVTIESKNNDSELANVTIKPNLELTDDLTADSCYDSVKIEVHNALFGPCESDCNFPVHYERLLPITKAANPAKEPINYYPSLDDIYKLPDNFLQVSNLAHQMIDVTGDLERHMALFKENDCRYDDHLRLQGNHPTTRKTEPLLTDAEVRRMMENSQRIEAMTKKRYEEEQRKLKKQKKSIERREEPKFKMEETNLGVDKTSHTSFKFDGLISDICSAPLFNSNASK